MGDVFTRGDDAYPNVFFFFPVLVANSAFFLDI